MQSYYIETSIGRMKFQTTPTAQRYDDRDVMFYPRVLRPIPFIPDEPDQFNLFFKLFVHDGFEIKQTELGEWFLFVNLDDPYYGRPEYKMYPTG
jgi:hypothetical protein